MEDYYINLIVNFLLMVFGVISVGELLYDKSVTGNRFSKIRLRGWYLVLCALLSVAFNFYRDWNADAREKASGQAKARVDSMFQQSQSEILRLQLSTKDSIINSVQNAYATSIKASNEALARYNIRITDSMHSVVSTLKLNAANPQLLLAPLEPGKQPAFVQTVDGRKRFSVQFITKGGTSYHIDLTCCIMRDTVDYPLLQCLSFSRGAIPIVEDVTSTREVLVAPEIFLESKTLVLFTGRFSKDPEGNFTIPFNTAFNFNFRENKFLSALDLDFEALKKTIGIK